MVVVIGVASVLALSAPASAEARTNYCPTIKVNNDTYVVTAEGVRCPVARRYAKRYLRHGIEPRGWKCNRGACSDRSSDAYFIFYRPVDRVAPASRSAAAAAGS